MFKLTFDILFVHCTLFCITVNASCSEQVLVKRCNLCYIFYPRNETSSWNSTLMLLDFIDHLHQWHHIYDDRLGTHTGATTALNPPCCCFTDCSTCTVSTTAALCTGVQKTWTISRTPLTVELWNLAKWYYVTRPFKLCSWGWPWTKICDLEILSLSLCQYLGHCQQ